MTIKLSPWQTRVLDDQHRFKVVDVGRRAGKTLLSCLALIQKSSTPKTVCWYIAPTYKQSKLIAWTMLKEFCKDFNNAVFNETELRVDFTDRDSSIHLKGADNPDSLRGTHIDFAVFDEVAFFTSWNATWTALRPVLVDSKASCWFISTPNGFNHFYELYNKQNTDSDYISFHYTSYDNPYIDREEIEKTKREMNEMVFKQEFLADFTRPQGTVYTDWSIDNFISVPYDNTLPIHITMDYGVNDPTSIIWIQPNGSEFRVIDYYEATDANISHYASVITSKPYKTAELYTGDEAGRARTLTTGTSPIEELQKHGIFVKTTPGLKIVDQIRITHKHIKSLYVDNKLNRFRDCILNYRYPEKRETAVNQSNEIPIHDQYSHAMRALEYYFVNKTEGIDKKYDKYLPQFQETLDNDLGM
jgi:hypothetical protein